MKMRNIATPFFVFLLLPATLYLATRLEGRFYYLIAAMILAEGCIPLIWAYNGKGIRKSLMVIILIMSFITVLLRVVIPVPNFKPVYAFIMLTGIGLGAQSGFVTGALTALVSNFFFGQGAYLPWQMLAFGMGGMIAGICFCSGRLPRKPMLLAVYGFVSVMVMIGPMLDCSQLIFLSRGSDISAVLRSGLTVNFNQALCSLITMLIFGRPVIDKLERYKKKFDLKETDNGL